MLVKSGLKKAVLDCDTRWNSIYNMLQRLCELKAFCRMKAADIPSLELSNNDWNLIESLVITCYLTVIYFKYNIFLIIIYFIEMHVGFNFGTCKNWFCTATTS